MLWVAQEQVFESDVISDGTQTNIHLQTYQRAFESDVISDGTQTLLCSRLHLLLFESDVISDGTQTVDKCFIEFTGLRVM